MNRYLPEGRLLNTPENQALLDSPAALQTAMEQHTVLEGVAVRCDRAHDLTIRCGGFTGVIPRSEAAVGVDDGSVKEIAILSRVGKPTCFVIDGLTADGKLLLSRKKVQLLALHALMQCAPGTILPATVTHLEPFGAFVDVGCGVPSLVPIEAISVSRIPHPSCRFHVHQEIFVMVRDTQPTQNRLLLTHKELLGTWQENAARFSAGETVTGIVRGVMDFGIFVELAPNLPGLAEYQSGYETGDCVTVYIKTILPEKQKIKLLLLDHAAPFEPMLHYCLPEDSDLF